MSNRFYPRLAAQNLRKNGRFYLPYLITVMGAVAALYILTTTNDPRGVRSLSQFGALEAILGMGCGVVSILCGAFLLYTNSFLMKQRGREFGLYSILGMSKGNIARMLLWETVYTALLGIGGGLVIGILFDKLLLLLLMRITGIEFSGPLVYGECAWKTAALFAIVLLLTFIINSGKVGLSQPIALLRSGSAGEREPKARWFLALLGAASLGGGYYISIVTTSPLQAILLFFVAVLLVIAGTFLLFLTGSVVVLKLLRRRKRYYYKTRHFIAVSGLMYRMKRNAAGLSLICILSTAVLVMLSSTVSLYTGIEDLIDARFPRRVMVYIGAADDAARWQPDAEKALDYVRAQGYHPESTQVYRSLATSGALVDGGFSCDQKLMADGWDNTIGVEELYILPAPDYEALTGQETGLRDGQMLIQSGGGFKGEISVFGKKFSIAGELPENEAFRAFKSINAVVTVTAMVVTEADFQEIYELQLAGYGDMASHIMTNLNFDLPEGEDAAACRDALDVGMAIPAEVTVSGSSVDREMEKTDLRAFFGGLLFLGIFLGILFLAGTVLIIYYKQVSEGYEDQGRFEIMQKVGMSRPEIAGSIRSQVLLVFFLPLGTAVLHMAAACPLIVRLLRAFQFTNLPLFLGCVGVCIAAFAVIYTIVYSVTARTYYGIVSHEGRR